MKSNLAKVLHQLDGRPLVNHVCETALKLSPRTIYVVVGHQADDVKAAVLSEFDAGMFEFPVQQQQLGLLDRVQVRLELGGAPDRVVGEAGAGDDANPRDPHALHRMVVVAQPHRRVQPLMRVRLEEVDRLRPEDREAQRDALDVEPVRR